MMERTPLEAWIARRIGCGVSLTRGALQAWQLARLRETIDLARSRSPFYRELLRDVGGPPADLAGISRLPFTTAEDLRSRPQQFVCVSQSDIQRVVTLRSSGTTGAAKRLYFTAADIEHTLDFFAAGMSTFTRPGDRVLICLPGDLPDSVGDLLARALSRIGAHGIRHGPVRDAGATLAVMHREAATVLVGIPVQVLGLARSSRGLPLQVHSVLLSTDYVPGAIRSAVEAAWGCRVYNHYGMTETGLGGGVDCAARQGYHLREADLYVEIIDPHTGALQPDGEAGEIVVTTLTRTGMPLLRYRTGDCARVLAGACPCGTVLRRMAHVRGRIGRSVGLRNGRSLALCDLDEALFSVEGLLDYRAAVRQGGGACTLQLQIRAVPDRAQDISFRIRHALLRSGTLRESFLDGCLVVESVRLSRESWFTDGVAKRLLIIISPGANGQP